MRKIVVYGDPVLTEQAADVTEFDEDLTRLAAEMHQTMIDAKGVGLAAPQVGVSKQIAIIDLSVGEDPDQLVVLINPKVLEIGGAQKGEEGCLSFPGIFTVVERPEYCKIESRTLAGDTVIHEAEGFKARAFLHEIDHLNGVLMTDRVSAMKRDMIKRKVQKRVKAGEWA